MSEKSIIHTTAEKRMLLSSIFIVILIGIAYSQMITVIMPLFHTNSLLSMDVMLCVIFFIMSFRFFVGNQLHLLNPEINSSGYNVAIRPGFNHATNATHYFSWKFMCGPTKHKGQL